MFATFLFRTYVGLSKWWNLDFFWKDAPWKALQKQYKQNPIDLFWWFILYVKWTIHVIVSATSTVLSTIKIFGRFLCSVLEICSHSFYRAFDGTSFKKRTWMLSFSIAEIYVKQKRLPSIFIEFNTLRRKHSHRNFSF